jgi:hypothetical protein
MQLWFFHAENNVELEQNVARAWGTFASALMISSGTCFYKWYLGILAYVYQCSLSRPRGIASLSGLVCIKRVDVLAHSNFVFYP